MYVFASQIVKCEKESQGHFENNGAWIIPLKSTEDEYSKAEAVYTHCKKKFHVQKNATDSSVSFCILLMLLLVLNRQI